MARREQERGGGRGGGGGGRVGPPSKPCGMADSLQQHWILGSSALVESHRQT